MTIEQCFTSLLIFYLRYKSEEELACWIKNCFQGKLFVNMSIRVLDSTNVSVCVCVFSDPLQDDIAAEQKSHSH